MSGTQEYPRGPRRERRQEYICIDLKSFYASVECVDRNLNPLTANLVVADESRSDKTICLAVTPSLKALGVPGRGRLFEVKQRLQEIKALTGKEIDFIVAVPRMQRYLDVSSEIYEVYLKYVSPGDIHVYSVDEAFIDVTPYLGLYHMTAHELAITMIRDVLATTGITATAGVGTNLYLAKIAMDIVAKKMPADKDGVRIADLDEMSFREKLWDHEPLTDFWHIAGGISNRLAKMGIHTMGDLARMSLTNEEWLFKEFGIDAEILIDHAWGLEPTRMEHIKKYRPSTTSLSSGQVLKRGYTFEETRNVIREMAEQVVLDLIEKGLVAGGMVLYIGYEQLPKEGSSYSGAVHMDHYGRKVPVSARGTAKLGAPTATPSKIIEAVMELFDRIVEKELLCRRVFVTAIRVMREEDTAPQISFFSDHREDRREVDLAKAQIALHRRFGKNAVFKANDLFEAATTIERNGQIGGHRK